MWERKKKKVDFISVLLSFYKIILHAKLVYGSFWCKMYEKKINGIVFSLELNLTDYLKHFRL